MSYAKNSKPARDISQRGDRGILKSIPLNEALDPMDSFDFKEARNPQNLAYYAREIYENLTKGEKKLLPTCDQLNQQPEVNHKMRSILVDWLISVHKRFKLQAETLYLTVSLIDRYLAKKSITKQQLQLVGVASVLISTKYEEIYPPETRDLVYITDRAYTKEQILNMEMDILSTLDFSITVASQLRFVERYSKVAALDPQSVSLARYLIELALIEQHMLKYSPSVQAVAAVYLSQKIQKKPDVRQLLYTHSGYNEADVKPCAKEMVILFHAAPRHVLTAVREKFSARDFHSVASMRI